MGSLFNKFPRALRFHGQIPLSMCKVAHYRRNPHSTKNHATIPFPPDKNPQAANYNSTPRPMGHMIPSRPHPHHQTKYEIQTHTYKVPCPNKSHGEYR